MKNIIDVKTPVLDGNKITYEYSVSGKWEEAFSDERFSVEYDLDIHNVPESVLIIPFLANILPMSWVYNAEIIIPVCDKDFFESIPDFKKGYEEMYPSMTFGGTISVKEIQENRQIDQEGSVAFFSGGVDAHCTLIRHAKEKPLLITLWGSDVKVDNPDAWNRVKNANIETAHNFNVDYTFVKSTFRRFLNQKNLDKIVEQSKDAWWHGFQHGIGILSHAAPVVYALKKKTIYIASSFQAKYKGKYTCASDPSIDNYVRYCGAHVVHDGYELSRYDKVDIITDYSKKSGTKINIRACWASKYGTNCCHCEKCWRTILAIYATKNDPREYGFDYDSFDNVARDIKDNRKELGKFKEARYKRIWEAIRQNYTRKSINPSIRWFYSSRFSELETGTIFERGLKKTKRLARKVLKKLHLK